MSENKICFHQFDIILVTLSKYSRQSHKVFSDFPLVKEDNMI